MRLQISGIEVTLRISIRNSQTAAIFERSSEEYAKIDTWLLHLH